MSGAAPAPQWYIGWRGDYQERRADMALYRGTHRDYCRARYGDSTMGVRLVRRMT